MPFNSLKSLSWLPAETILSAVAAKLWEVKNDYWLVTM